MLFFGVRLRGNVSGLFGGGGEHSAFGGGEGFDTGHDVVGHVETGGSDHGTLHFSPLSPVIIAMFVTSFGGMGMVALKFFNLNEFITLPLALVSGLVIGGISFLIFHAIFKATSSSSESSRSDLAGLEAEVITPIPEGGGLGEIAYSNRGTRYTAPARSIYKTAVSAHSVVTIDKIVGNIFFVKPGESSKVL